MSRSVVMQNRMHSSNPSSSRSMSCASNLRPSFLYMSSNSSHETSSNNQFGGHCNAHNSNSQPSSSSSRPMRVVSHLYSSDSRYRSIGQVDAVVHFPRANNNSHFPSSRSQQSYNQYQQQFSGGNGSCSLSPLSNVNPGSDRPLFPVRDSTIVELNIMDWLVKIYLTKVLGGEF